MSTEPEDDGQEWYDHKAAVMEELLGPSHDIVMHSVIPYSVGGALDLYYYPNGIPGTGIATLELSEAPGEGSSNDVFPCYEMVMFTRHPIDLDAAKNPRNPFGKAHRAISSILNLMARYSAEATLNPGETCEFPEGMPDVGGRCLVFDAYPPHTQDVDAEFGLMVMIEVFRSEMEFARENSGDELLELLKAQGHYPYSDLDREPVA